MFLQRAGARHGVHGPRPLRCGRALLEVERVDGSELPHAPSWCVGIPGFHSGASATPGRPAGFSGDSWLCQ